MKLRDILLLFTLSLSIASLFLEQLPDKTPALFLIINSMDFMILGLLLFETVLGFITAKYKWEHVKKNLFSLLFVSGFTLLFFFSKTILTHTVIAEHRPYLFLLIIIRNLFLVLKIFSRFRRFSSFLKNITTQPAQTILYSFLMVILVGALLLMMPFTSRQGNGLSFINSLFTSASAVCVTGLVVVDTAAHFSPWGQLIIMVLIQIGGLGIMILSFFTLYILGRSLSIEDKLLLSYIIDERDMRGLVKNLKSIVLLTFLIELGGAGLLFLGFAPQFGFTLKNAFYSGFHAVSAFCNAGFSLFSDSLEGFRDNWPINLTITALIIAGGLSFLVITNLLAWLPRKLGNLLSFRKQAKIKLNTNTKLVLILTVSMILGGMLLVYGLEHFHAMQNYNIFEQYLSAFFQSVTLRTAGFNTIPFQNLTHATYLVMIVFMFIGGAAGSTAGGIKVNSVGVIGAYVYSVFKNRTSVTIFNHSIDRYKVTRALFVFLLGISAIMLATIILSISESAPISRLLFEATSAFGTVGLSAGITPALSNLGKMVIIVLMFVGRVGPLTLLAASSRQSKNLNISYPKGDISIG